jgi:hypothetical protein
MLTMISDSALSPDLLSFFNRFPKEELHQIGLTLIHKRVIHLMMNEMNLMLKHYFSFVFLCCHDKPALTLTPQSRTMDKTFYYVICEDYLSIYFLAISLITLLER